METDEERRTIKSRRRGAVLEKAIRDAVLTELLEVGYGGLTFDSVAARARAGKASLYRRWPTREEMIMDALNHGMPPIDDPRSDTGSLRQDVLQALRLMNTMMTGPVGKAIAGLIGRRHRYPELAAAVRNHLVMPRLLALEEIFRRDAERRGVVVRTDTSAGNQVRVFLEMGPAMVLWRHMLDGSALDDQELENAVDTLLLPLWESLTQRAQSCGE